LAAQILLDQLVVMLDSRLDELLPELLNLVEQGIGHRTLRPARTERLLIVDVLDPPDDVDHPREEFALPERILDREDLRTEAVLDHLHDVVEIRANAVHLVDERD